MTTTTAYRSAVALALGTALFLLFGIGALGIIGVEGDRADLMFLGVIAVGAVGTLIARLRPNAMARAMTATAAATALVGVIALMLGKHNAEASSAPEILGLCGMYAALFTGSARLFRSAATSDS
jgi:hypothetical protein